MIDHGKRIETPHHAVNRISIPRNRPFSEVDRLGLVQAMVSGLLRYYDSGVYADCDELIAMQCLDEQVLADRGVLIVPTFEAYIEDRADSGPKLLGLFNPSMCKPMIFKSTPAWNPGFHVALGVDPPAMLAVPMAHIRFVNPAIFRERMVTRRRVHEGMLEQEHRTGVAGHWGSGSALLDEFQQRTNELANVNAPIDPFKPIPSEAVLSCMQVPTSPQSTAAFWHGGTDYRTATKRYDLGNYFPRLLGQVQNRGS